MMGQMLSNSDSELSNDNMNNSQLGGNKHISSMMTGFDDDISKSIDDKNFQITERALDEEQAAKEEYMRKLMSFRKDELLLPDESENDEEDDDSTGFKNNKQNEFGAENAYHLVENIEKKMVNIANVIRGMDKRMSYNLRLMGSVMMKDEPNQYTEFDNQVEAGHVVVIPEPCDEHCTSHNAQ